MRPYRLRTDLKRAVIDGYALPLGLIPGSIAEAPRQGYTVEYVAGEDDESDTYSFHIVVSHERLAPILHRLLDLLPEEVYGIVEIGSRDAYRAMDVYMAQEPIPRRQFMRGWRRYESFLLEDASIAAGANSEEPFVEVFLDQWKGLSVLVPLLVREEIETILDEFDVQEVPLTWGEESDEAADALLHRSVLAIDDEYSPDVDELLMELRHAWSLELNVDPDHNVNDAGRELGWTLWQAMAIVESATNPHDGAYASIWATARSMGEMERLIDEALAASPQWRFAEIYTIDRVAFDERPDELAALPPLRDQAEVHLVSFDPWPATGDGSGKMEQSRD